MKSIVEALRQTEYRPRKRWWGFKKDGLQYLCRYNHVMCVFDPSGDLLYKYQLTRTDKAGVEFAIKHVKEKI